MEQENTSEGVVLDVSKALGISKYDDFRKELESLINCHSQDSNSDTPDFILAEYLTDCLKAFDKATTRRTDWYYK